MEAAVKSISGRREKHMYSLCGGKENGECEELRRPTWLECRIELSLSGEAGRANQVGPVGALCEGVLSSF